MSYLVKLLKRCFYLIFFIPVCAVAMNDLPDPTRPADWLVQTEPVFVEQIQIPGKKIEWRLTAIRIAKNDRSAILNGKLVRVGDMVNSATVIEIQPRAVIVDHEEKKLIVKLLSMEVKKEYTTYR